MSRLSSRVRLAVGLAGWIASASLASALALVVAHPQPVAAPAAAMQQAMKASALPEDLLDLLRSDAALGNAEASGELATHLLDRFERSGDRDDLHEAMQWIARDWDQPPYLRSSLLNRMVTEHCGRPVLRWHWLCSGGD